MRYAVLFCTALFVIAAVRGVGGSAAGRYFTVKDDVLETIRQLVGEANQEAVSLPSPEVMARIKIIIENEINKFRYVGQRAEYSVDSCHSINELQPCSPSGYYFVDTMSGPIAVWCAMNQENLLPGGWMRVAMINMTNNASHCPNGLSEVTTPKRLCVKPVTTAGCSSTYLDVHGINYSKVCGRVKGYQYHTPEAFYAYSYAASRRQIWTLEHGYVDGVSITYNRPRKHIWTLVAAQDEARDAATMDRACPCTNTELEYGGTLPPFVGEDYFCETGSRTTAHAKYYLQDPLWDGEGCGVDSTCCDHSQWFCKDLGEETNSDVELRDDIGEDLEDLLNLKAFLLSVEQALDNLDIANPSKGCVKPGQFIFDFLGAAGLTHATCPTLLDQCGKAISCLTSDSRSFRNGNNIQKFVDAVKIIFSQPGAGDPRDSSHHYKVFLKSEEAKKKQKSDVWTAPAAESSSKKETRTLSYWCFSPGYAMANLTAQGVRSIVLTSGTLSPLDSFSSELCVDFPIQYEGPHIVSKEQVWVGVVSRGCDGAVLNSSYERRSTSSYQTSLGNTIVNFARIVPHGVLVFFPSYPVMHSCVDFWRENGILPRIEQYKPVFLEPKRKADFNPTMDAFYENIGDPKTEGAIFFAVCRGKVSEGLDFANNNGRAVIITGLPYPPRMDPKVELKMEYLGEAQKKSHSVVLGGQEWYRQQASRTVNQAVGRVIRHRNDYGAILLCDERFAYPNTINQLPKWVRPFVQTYTKFGLIQRDLTQFFRNAEKKFGTVAPKKPSTLAQSSQPEGEPNQSLRGPIVVRDPSWRRKGIVPQDASVVETHVTSKRTGVPQASLTKLRDEEERSVRTKSLLNSLERAEVGSTSAVKQVSLHRHSDSQQGPSLSESILQSQSSEQPGPSSAAARPKKMLVVSKKQKQVKKVASIAGFIDEIQSNLSDQAYASFKTALGTYKKKHDIYAFTESLKDIFKQPSLYHLLQGLQPFLLEEHRQTFSIFYHEFTGRELGTPSLQQLSGLKRKGTATHASGPKEKIAKKKGSVSDGGVNEGASSSLLRTDHLLDSSSHLNHGKNHLTS